METWLIIFLIGIGLAVISIIGAILMIISNHKRKSYINSHKEKGYVMQKRVLKEDSRAHKQILKHLIDVRFISGEMKSFEVSPKLFNSIKSGETALLAYRNLSLLFYESNHLVSSKFKQELSERFPFYHSKKQGKTCRFYCRIPTKNYLIDSSDSIDLDASEIRLALLEMEGDIESYIVLSLNDSTQMEIIRESENRYEVHWQSDSDEWITFIDDEEEAMTIVDKWMEKRLSESEYGFLRQ